MLVGLVGYFWLKLPCTFLCSIKFVKTFNHPLKVHLLVCLKKLHLTVGARKGVHTPRECLFGTGRRLTGRKEVHTCCKEALTWRKLMPTCCKEVHVSDKKVGARGRVSSTLCKKAANNTLEERYRMNEGRVSNMPVVVEFKSNFE